MENIKLLLELGDKMCFLSLALLLTSTDFFLDFVGFLLWGKGIKVENIKWRTALTVLQVTCSDPLHAVHAYVDGGSTQ